MSIERDQLKIGETYYRWSNFCNKVISVKVTSLNGRSVGHSIFNKDGVMTKRCLPLSVDMFLKIHGHSPEDVMESMANDDEM